jgi:hypothetical protein
MNDATYTGDARTVKGKVSAPLRARDPPCSAARAAIESEGESEKRTRATLKLLMPQIKTFSFDYRSLVH